MTDIIGASPAARPAQRPDEVRVDGVVIPRAAIAREIQHHAARTPMEAWHAAAGALVVRELLLAEARRLGIAPEPVPPQLMPTRYGFHIVRVAQRIAGADLPFAAVEAAIAAHLEATSWHIAVRQYLSLLSGKADIRGVTLGGTATPLVQ